MPIEKNINFALNAKQDLMNRIRETQVNGEKLTDKAKKIEDKKADLKTMVLSFALADGKVSDKELEMLARVDFTAEDVANVLNNPTERNKALNLNESDKQKLTDELMTRLETYKAINKERESQEKPKFGL